MRKAFVLAVAVFLMAAPARADDDDPEPPSGNWAWQKLRGKWFVTGTVRNGTESPSNQDDNTWEFDRGKLTITSPKGYFNIYRVKLLAQKKPIIFEMFPDG